MPSAIGTSRRPATTNPLEDGTLEAYKVHAVPLSTMTVEALKEVEGHHATRGGALEELLRAWPHVLAVRPADRDDARLHETKFAGRTELVDGNTRAFKAGYNYGETSRGLHRLVRGATGEACAGHLPQHHGQPGAVARPRRRLDQSGLDLFLGAYPITPASGILEELARYKHFESARSRPRTRSRPQARRSAPRSAERSA